MFTKETILAQYEVTEGRYINAYFVCVVKEDGKEISRSNPHNICFAPDADMGALREANQGSMTSMGWPAIPDSEWDRIVHVCDGEHTPGVKAAYEAWKAQLKEKK